jgi:tetratricopeptide (TPR) repeat protein
MRTFRPAALLVSSVFAAFVSGQALAVGDDSSGSEEAPKPTQTTTECKKGEVWDKKAKKCVVLKEQGMRDLMGDDGLYDAARELAYFGRPNEAITLLRQMSGQQQARVQNYLGFAHRKAGHLEIAMLHYNTAIAMDPDHVLARSYMGQGKLEEGNFSAAYEQLQEIKMRAGKDNYAYRELAKAIAGLPTSY